MAVNVRGPVLLVAEELGQLPDEAYTKFTHTVRRQFASRGQVVLAASSPAWSDRWPPTRILARTTSALRAARHPELDGRRPELVVYASRSSITTPALARARLLRWRCRAPVAMVALQGKADAVQGAVGRRLAPDLLLLPTEGACRTARELGLRALRVTSGVDLDRFRPPGPGEKAALRRKWGLPADRQLFVHVGHLKEGRNLRAIAPLAGRQDSVVLVVASGQRGPESEALQAELERCGVIVLAGYRADVEELYRLADCYVFPTASADSAVAMPLSILEALASDLPVTSVRFGALDEGLGRSPGVELVDDPAELPARALALVQRRVQTRPLAEPYSWSAVVDRMIASLDELLRSYSVAAVGREP